MHILDVLQSKKTTFSFEFFPPKTAKSSEILYRSITQLEELSPDFVSVTYGAGGSTRELTHDLVIKIKEHTTLKPIPHLTCVAHKRLEINELLERYSKAKIKNILALSGDLPTDKHDRSKDDFRFAIDLVTHIKKFASPPDSRGFGIGVAGFPEGHPATPNRLKDMDFLKAKVDAGADYLCTQLFFDNAAFYDFKERCEIAGVRIPIIAGIMPITSAKGMKRMAELSGGTNFPAALLKSIDRAQGDPESIARVGIHWATEQCRDLLDHNVNGIHFYTLNQSAATREIYQNLGLKNLKSVRQ